METLKLLRKGKSLTQQEVANFLGVERSTYVKYERGQIDPPTSTLIKLADFFSVSVDYLIGKEKSPSATADRLLVTDPSEVNLLHMFRALDAAAKARIKNALAFEYNTSVGDTENHPISQNA